MTRPTLVHDPEFTACPFYIRLERENGLVDFRDLRGARDTVSAVNMARAAGYRDIGFECVLVGKVRR